MEPQHNTFELPQPQEAITADSGEALASAPERQTAAPLAPLSSPAAQIDLQAAATVMPLTQQAPANASATLAGTQHFIADDADLIEKEWVVKAKSIVAQTKDDPYQQNQEMTKVRADYLKKRYNKDLKVSEG